MLKKFKINNLFLINKINNLRRNQNKSGKGIKYAMINFNYLTINYNLYFFIL